MNRHSAQSPSPLSFVVAALVVASSTSALVASERLPTDAACHAYDLHVLTLIEDHGLLADTSADVLNKAAFQMLEARIACREGDISRGLQLYATIDLGSVRMSPFYRIFTH